MAKAPMTLEEARKTYYGTTYGAKNLKSNYIEGRCAKGITVQEGMATYHHQCSRKNGHGPESLYCKAHAEAYIDHSDVETSTWYKMGTYDTVKSVEVVKSTEHFVWIKGESCKTSRSGYYTIVPTIAQVREILEYRLECANRAHEAAVVNHGEDMETLAELERTRRPQ